MQLCKGKKANDNWVFVLNFSTIVPPGGRQTLHPYQLVLKSMCLSYFFRSAAILSYDFKYKHFVIYNVPNGKHRILKVQMRLWKVFNPILKSCKRRLYKVSITCDVAKRRYSCELSKLLTDTIQGQLIYNIISKHFTAI